MTDALAGIGCYLTAAPTRDMIERLERMLLAATQAHVDVPVEHTFAPGLYLRTARIAAGTVLTGKVHLTEHGNVCAGDITVWTEQGMRRITGVETLVSLPGCKRAGYAHADTVWITVHANPGDCRDLALLEARLVEDAGRLLNVPVAELLEAA